MTTYTHERGFAAVLIDFENLYYELKRGSPSIEATEYILTVVRSLRLRLEQVVNASPIITKAYADFERLESSPQGSLYLMGVETHNVLGTEHKNAADMRLCIDTLEVLYTRPEIHNFVLVAGDRDYIPVVQHLRRQGKNVIVASFRSNLSGDLLQNIQRENFIDAFELLSEEERREIELARARAVEQSPELVKRRPMWTTKQAQNYVIEQSSRIAQLESSEAQKEGTLQLKRKAKDALPIPSVSDVVSAGTVRMPEIKLPIKEVLEEPSYCLDDEDADDDYSFAEEKPILDESSRRCLTIMLENFGQHREIWMSPLLWKLSNTMPLLADFERKALIGNLQSAGAIKVVKRHGDTHDYSVVVLNYNHKSVRECMP